MFLQWRAIVSATFLTGSRWQRRAHRYSPCGAAPPEIAEAVDPHEELFDRPSSGRLQVRGTQEPGERAPVGEREVIGVTQPIELGALQDVDSQGSQVAILFPPDLIGTNS
jgi:hypothetical protein